MNDASDSMILYKDSSSWSEAMKHILQSEPHAFQKAISSKLSDPIQACIVHDALQW